MAGWRLGPLLLACFAHGLICTSMLHTNTKRTATEGHRHPCTICWRSLGLDRCTLPDHERSLADQILMRLKGM